MIGDYPRPILVNGYKCANCSDVDKAKKNIDPAHPEDGPFGVNKVKDAFGIRHHAVKFGGSLAHLSPPVPSAEDGTKLDPTVLAAMGRSGLGQRLDITV